MYFGVGTMGSKIDSKRINFRGDFAAKLQPFGTQASFKAVDLAVQHFELEGSQIVALA